MLRITVNTSSAGATRYYSEGLSRQDYYSEKGEIIGNWGGKAAEKFGLSGQVSKEEFEALCYNTNPKTGEQLTARNTDGRRVGYDFTFDVPKSVSICYAHTEDKDILHSFRSAVNETMLFIEKDAQTRVRVGGAYENRDTGNLIWGEFVHDTSRPVNGVPDCHLHSHNFVINATWDDTEQKFKAIEIGQVKANGGFYEAYFNNRLAQNLQDCGYALERNEHNFELLGIKRETIDKFSNRTKEIEALAIEKKITDAKALDSLGSRTRENKREGLDREELKQIWRDRLTDEEHDSILEAKKPGNDDQAKQKESAKDMLAFALSHHLERKSTVTEKELLTTALKRGVGNVPAMEIINHFKERDDLIKGSKKGTQFVTTKEAVAEEKNLINTCRDAKGNAKPLNQDYIPKAEFLNQEQKMAINNVLKSKDKIVIVEGGAGTGKTTLMQEVKAGIEEKGKKLFAFAPSSEASRGVLENEGFKGAQTVARLLIDPNMQNQLKGQALWIDEAGMLGNKQMNQVLKIARAQDARLILTGDTRQHASVERGDALRIMQKYGGLRASQVREIQRQKSADYKKAVSYISKGEVEKGFNKLEGFGAIKEVNNIDERFKMIAEDYVASSKERKGKDFKSVLVVAPTHKENSLITTQIRSKLKEDGKLDAKERRFSRLENLNLTEAQKQDAVNYKEGQIVQFHKNVKGFKIGNHYKVGGLDEKGQVLLNDHKGRAKVFALNEPSHFSVFNRSELELAKGDKIRVTQNGKTLEGKRLNNGSVYTVKGFDREGNILANNGSTISKDYGNFAHGYAVTSHSSQGKTVDKVIIAQSSMSFRASSVEQFYVSVSRGKESVAIYTDDKRELFSAVNRSGQRMTATELAGTRQEPGKEKGKIIRLDEHRDRLERLKEIVKTATSRAKVSLSKIPNTLIKVARATSSKTASQPPRWTK
jgi:conjugative relaxase-like TrwC/TraI family protein